MWGLNPRPKNPWCVDDAISERVVVPEGEREGTQGYQLRLEAAPGSSL